MRHFIINGNGMFEHEEADDESEELEEEQSDVAEEEDGEGGETAEEYAEGGCGGANCPGGQCVEMVDAATSPTPPAETSQTESGPEDDAGSEPVPQEGGEEPQGARRDRITAQVIVNGVDLGLHLLTSPAGSAAPGPGPAPVPAPAPAAAPAPAPTPARFPTPAVLSVLSMVLAVAIMLAAQPMLQLSNVNRLLRDITGSLPQPFDAPPAGPPMVFTDSHFKVDINTRRNLAEENGQCPSMYEFNARVTCELPTQKRDANHAQESTATESTASSSSAPASSQPGHQTSQNAPSTDGQELKELSTFLNYMRIIFNNYLTHAPADQQQLMSMLQDALHATQFQSPQYAPVSLPSTSRPNVPPVHHCTCHQQALRMTTSSSELAPGVSNNVISEETRLSVSNKHPRSAQNPPCPSTSTGSTGFTGPQRRSNHPNQERILQPEINIPVSSTSTSRHEQTSMAPETPESLVEHYQDQPVYSDNETSRSSQRVHPDPRRQDIATSSISIRGRGRLHGSSRGHALPPTPPTASRPSTSRPNVPSVHHYTCHQQALRMATSSSSELAPGVSNNVISKEPRPSVSNKHPGSAQNPPCPSTSTGSTGFTGPNNPNQESILQPEINIPVSSTSTSRHEQTSRTPETPESLVEHYQDQPVYSENETSRSSQRVHPDPRRQDIATSSISIRGRGRLHGSSRGHALTPTTSAIRCQGSSTAQGRFQTRTCPQLSTMHSQDSVNRNADCRRPRSSRNLQQQAEMESDTEGDFQEDSNRSNSNTPTNMLQSSPFEESIEQQEISNRPQDLRTVVRDEHGWSTSEFMSSSQHTSGHQARSSERLESRDTGLCRSQQLPPAPHQSAQLQPTGHQEEPHSQYSQCPQYNVTYPYLSTVNSHHTVMRSIPDPHQHCYGFNTRVSGNNPYHLTEYTPPPQEIQTFVQETRRLEHNIAEEVVDCTIHTSVEDSAQPPILLDTLNEAASAMELRQLSADTQPICGYTGQPSTAATAMQSLTGSAYQHTGRTTNMPHFTTYLPTYWRPSHMHYNSSAHHLNVPSAHGHTRLRPRRTATTRKSTVASAHLGADQTPNRTASLHQATVTSTHIPTDLTPRSTTAVRQSTATSSHVLTDPITSITAPLLESNEQSTNEHMSLNPGKTVTAPQTTKAFSHAPTDYSTSITASERHSNVPFVHGHSSRTHRRTVPAYQSTLALAQVPTDYITSITEPALHSVVSLANGLSSHTPSRTVSAPQLPVSFPHLQRDQTAIITASQHFNVPLDHGHSTQILIKEETTYQSTRELAQMPSDHITNITELFLRSVVPLANGISSPTPSRTETAPRLPLALPHLLTDQTDRITASEGHSNVPLDHRHSSQTPSRLAIELQSTLASTQVPTDCNTSITEPVIHSVVSLANGPSTHTPSRTVSAPQLSMPFPYLPTGETASINASGRHAIVPLSQVRPRQTPSRTRQSTLAQVPTNHIGSINTSALHPNRQSTQRHWSETPSRTVTPPQSPLSLILAPTDQTAYSTASETHSTNTTYSEHPSKTPSNIAIVCTSNQCREIPHSNLQSPHGHSSQMPRKTTVASESTVALVHVPGDQTSSVATCVTQSTKSSTPGRMVQASDITASTSQPTSSYGYLNPETSSTATEAESITPGVVPKREEGTDALDHHRQISTERPQCVLREEPAQGLAGGSGDSLLSTEHDARVLCEVQTKSAARVRSRDQNQLQTGLRVQQNDSRDLGLIDNRGKEEDQLLTIKVETEDAIAPEDECEQQNSASGEEEIERQVDACENDPNREYIASRGEDEDELQSAVRGREYDAPLPSARVHGECEQERDVIGRDKNVKEARVRGRDAGDVEESRDGSLVASHPPTSGSRRRASSPLPDPSPSRRPRLDDFRTNRAAVAASHAALLYAMGSSMHLMLGAFPPKFTPDTLAMWQTFITQAQEQAHPEGGSLNLEALVQALKQAQPAVPSPHLDFAARPRTQAPDNSSSSGSSRSQSPGQVSVPGTSHAPGYVHVTSPGLLHPQALGHEDAPGSSLAEAWGRLTVPGYSQVLAPDRERPPSTSESQDNTVNEPVATSATDGSVSPTGVSPDIPLGIVIPLPVSPFAASPDSAVRDNDDPSVSPGSITPVAVSCSGPLHDTVSSCVPPSASNRAPFPKLSEVYIKEETMNSEPVASNSWRENENSSVIDDYAASASSLDEFSDFGLIPEDNLTMNIISQNFSDITDSSNDSCSETLNLHFSDHAPSALTVFSPNEQPTADFSSPPSTDTLAQDTKHNLNPCPDNTFQVMEGTNFSVASTSRLVCSLSNTDTVLPIKQKPDGEHKAAPTPSSRKKRNLSKRSSSEKVKTEAKAECSDTDDNEDSTKKLPEQKKKYKKNIKFKKKGTPKSRRQWTNNLRKYKEEKK